MISCSSAMASSAPPTSLKVTPTCSRLDLLGLALADAEYAAAAASARAAHAPHHEVPDSADQNEGEKADQYASRPGWRLP